MAPERKPRPPGSESESAPTSSLTFQEEFCHKLRFYNTNTDITTHQHLTALTCLKLQINCFAVKIPHTLYTFFYDTESLSSLMSVILIGWFVRRNPQSKKHRHTKEWQKECRLAAWQLYMYWKQFITAINTYTAVCETWVYLKRHQSKKSLNSNESFDDL